MKREGYAPHQAAAIEAVTSTGGQIMPPVMGAAAFIMAEIVGVPYTDIMLTALLPALLFFGSAFALAYVAQFLFLITLVEAGDVNEYLAQFMGLFIYGAMNFIINKKLTFR